MSKKNLGILGAIAAAAVFGVSNYSSCDESNGWKLQEAIYTQTTTTGTVTAIVKPGLTTLVLPESSTVGPVSDRPLTPSGTYEIQTVFAVHKEPFNHDEAIGKAAEAASEKYGHDPRTWGGKLQPCGDVVLSLIERRIPVGNGEVYTLADLLR